MFSGIVETLIRSVSDQVVITITQRTALEIEAVRSLSAHCPLVPLVLKVVVLSNFVHSFILSALVVISHYQIQDGKVPPSTYRCCSVPRLLRCRPPGRPQEGPEE